MQAVATTRPAWRKTLMVAVPVVVLIVFIVLLGIGAGSSAVCSGCHSPQANALAASPHAGIDCESCHAAASGTVSSRADVLARMVPAELRGGGLHGPGRPVGNAACLRCHAKMVSAGLVSKNGISIDHTRCIVASTCEDCHDTAIHGTASRYVRTVNMNSCVACHIAKQASLECTVCHAGSTPTLKKDGPAWVRFHGAAVATTHGAQDLRSCAPCHTSTWCSRCHHVEVPHPQSFGQTHGKLVAKAGTAACFTCHKGQAYCDGCHGIEMPHPAGFLQDHSSIARGVYDPKCATCHVIDDCIQCHAYHVHPGGSGAPITESGGF